jgi:ornithine decarboxylase
MIQLNQKFDCATKAEIEQVILLGGKAEDIIFANSCKQEDHIEFARQRNVKLMTYDSVEEAEAIHEVYPNAELVLRIAVTDTDAPAPMGKKFGAHMSHWSQNLDAAKALGMKVRGVSFHVGTGGCKFDAYRISIDNAKTVFEMAEQKNMPAMDLVDIGGGFSSNADNSEYNFEKIAPRVMAHLDHLFPASSGVKLIGEPGR